jgi:hypothetical protein
MSLGVNRRQRTAAISAKKVPLAAVTPKSDRMYSSGGCHSGRALPHPTISKEAKAGEASD